MNNQNITKLKTYIYKHYLAIAAFLLSFFLTISISPDAVAIATGNYPVQLSTTQATNQTNELNAVNSLDFPVSTTAPAIAPALDNLFSEFGIPSN